MKSGGVVCLSGIDGCGKTSILQEFQRRLNEDGVKNRYRWLRYNHYFTKVLLLYCRVFGLTRYESVDGIRVGYHDFHRSRIVSWSFIALTYVDTLIVSVLLVYLPMLAARDRLLVCDRWVLDIMVDLEVDTGIRFEQGGWLEKAFLRLLPKGSQCFLVIRDKAAVLESRPENTKDRNFQKRWDLYQSFRGRHWVTEVRNESTITDAVDQIQASRLRREA